MKTKMIPVNGKPEIAFGVVRLEKTILYDFSDGMVKTKNATRPWDVERRCEVFRIIFRDWSYEFSLPIPQGTVLTLDNIDGADYKIKEHPTPLFWEEVHSKVRVTLPDGRRIEYATFSNVSPKKSLSAQEKSLVSNIEAKGKVKPRGKKGGREPDDGQEQCEKAVAKVLKLRNYNTSRSMTMERACKLAIKEFTLTITWQALAKQVRNSPKWPALKKRIMNARK